jgi:hypothetical protein
MFVSTRRSVDRAFAVAALLALPLLACSGPVGTPAARTPGADSVAAPAPSASPSSDARFAVALSNDSRYFVDQAGEPWFGRGDTAWSLIGQLSPEEIDRYLDDRAAKGFNLILVNVLEHYYSDNAPNNYSDDPPFTETAFQSAPNEAYWQHVDYAVEAARLRGITLLLAPAYLGNRDEEGWAAEVVSATDGDLAEYGSFLRDRYGDFPNIMWLIGHDRAPNDTEKARMEALTAALPTDDLVGLGAHPSADTLGTPPWSPTSISPDFETIYSYDDTAVRDAHRAWASDPARPVMFLEGRYEQERSGGLGDPMLRRQEYGAFVGGAAAVLFGNNPIWHFESVALFEYEGSWQDNLDSPGTSDARRFGDVAQSLPWWDSRPDVNSEFLVDGDPSANVAARYSDTHAVVYVPTQPIVVLDLTQLVAADQIDVLRIDPRSGDTTRVGTYPTTDLIALRSPGPNAAGDQDWVFVLSPST